LTEVRAYPEPCSNQKAEIVTTDREPDLIIDDDDRYSRMRMIGWWDQKKISAAKVLVVGAGALGNEVLKNLALLGFGHIYVIDMDTIDKTNLTRSVLFRAPDSGKPKSSVAARMMTEINPDCSVYPIMGNALAHIGLGLVRDVDVVFGCLDNREARLWVNRMCWKVSTPWIDGGIQEINGVAKVFRPPHGSCYECAMTEMDYKLIALRYSCPLLRQEEILQGKVPTAPTIASMIGALQVQEGLKLIHDLPTAESAALVFNGAANRFYKTDFPIKEDCMSHEFYDEPVKLELKAESTTVAQFFEAFHKATGKKAESIELDRDLVVSVDCPSCEHVEAVSEPSCLVGSDRAICPECSQPMVPTMISRIEVDTMSDATLSEIGIPAYDILKVDCAEETQFALLTGDRDGLGAELTKLI
jgi:adenylyltransferase/sulfurtransferase